MRRLELWEGGRRMTTLAERLFRVRVAVGLAAIAAALMLASLFGGGQ